METTHDSRSPAIEHAKELGGLGKFDAVRVISDNARTGTIVEFEQAGNPSKKTIRVKAVDDVQLCQTTGEFYNFDARLSLSKVLRDYLDELTLSPLQLLLNPSHLMRFENFDDLLSQCIGRVASVQSKKTKTPAHARTDFLYNAFAEIKKMAADYALLKKATPLKTQKFDEFISHFPSITDDRSRFQILAAIAENLEHCPDWTDKIENLVDLAEVSKNDEALHFLDGAIAEIMDSPTAIQQLIGGQGDLAGQLMILTHLAKGRAHAENAPNQAFTKLNNLMTLRPMTLTKKIILARIAQLLSSTHTLTKGDNKTDQQAFSSLIRTLTLETGLVGAEIIGHAVIRRARVIYRTPDEDLPVAKAVIKIFQVIPNLWTRLGFVFDVLKKTINDTTKVELYDILQSLVKHTQPPIQNADRDQIILIKQNLIKRCQNLTLPERLKKQMLEFLTMPSDAITTPKEPALKPGAAAKPAVDKKQLQPGKILFHEGDAGNEAFLIMSGSIEIYRVNGGDQQSLATLGRGEILGEMSLIDKQPRMASARAIEPTEVTIISEASLGARLEKLNQTDRVLRRLLDVMAARLRGQARVGD